MKINWHAESGFAYPKNSVCIVARRGAHVQSQIIHTADASEHALRFIIARLTRALRLSAIEELKHLVQSNKRYVEQTGRASEGVVLHPDHAAELLCLLER